MKNMTPHDTLARVSTFLGLQRSTVGVLAMRFSVEFKMGTSLTRQLQLIVGSCVLGIVALTSLLLWILGRTVFAPVARLAEGAQAGAVVGIGGHHFDLAPPRIESQPFGVPCHAANFEAGVEEARYEPASDVTRRPGYQNSHDCRIIAELMPSRVKAKIRFASSLRSTGPSSRSAPTLDS